MIQLQFKNFLFNRCLGGWVGKAVRILIQWWLLLWVPLEATFFFLLFKTVDVNFVQKCQICVENEKPDCSVHYNRLLISTQIMKKYKEVKLSKIYCHIKLINTHTLQTLVISFFRYLLLVIHELLDNIHSLWISIFNLITILPFLLFALKIFSMIYETLLSDTLPQPHKVFFGSLSVSITTLSDLSSLSFTDIFDSKLLT